MPYVAREQLDNMIRAVKARDEDKGEELEYSVDEITSDDIDYSRFEPVGMPEDPYPSREEPEKKVEVDKTNPWLQEKAPTTDNPWLGLDEEMEKEATDSSQKPSNPWLDDDSQGEVIEGKDIKPLPDLNPLDVLTGEVFDDPRENVSYGTGGGGGWGSGKMPDPDYVRDGAINEAHEFVLRMGEDFHRMAATEIESPEGVWDFATRVAPLSLVKTAANVADFMLYQAPKSVMIGGFATVDKLANIFEFDIGQAQIRGEREVFSDPVTGMDIYMDADPQDIALFAEMAQHGEGYANMMLAPFGASMSFGLEDGQEAYFEKPNLEKAWNNWSSDPFGTALGAMLFWGHTKTGRKKMRQLTAKALRRGEQAKIATPGDMSNNLGGLAMELAERDLMKDQVGHHAGRGSAEYAIEAMEAQMEFNNPLEGTFVESGRTAELIRDDSPRPAPPPPKSTPVRKGSELLKKSEESSIQLRGEPKYTSQEYDIVVDGMVQGGLKIEKYGDRAYIDWLEAEGADFRALKRQYLKENPEVKTIEALRVKPGQDVGRPVELKVKPQKPLTKYRNEVIERGRANAKEYGYKLTKADEIELSKYATIEAKNKTAAERMVEGKNPLAKNGKVASDTKIYSGGEYAALFEAIEGAYQAGKKGVKQVGKNLSDMAETSLEAAGWVKDMKERGAKMYLVDFLRKTKKEIPISLEARQRLSRKVGDNEVLVLTKVGKDGRPAIMQQGAKVNKLRANEIIGINELGSNIIPVVPVARAVKRLWGSVSVARDFLADILDVEDQYHRMGAPKTGMFVKIKPSVEAMWEAKGIEHIRLMSKRVRDRMFPGVKKLTMGQRADYARTMFEAVLAAESHKKMYEATGVVKEIAKELRTLMDNAQAVLREKGLNYDFKERFKTQLMERLERAEEHGLSVQEIAQLEQALSNLADYEFVHLPVGMIMEEWISSPDPANVGKAVRLLNSKKRKTPSIKEFYEKFQDQIDINDVGAPSVIASYYRRLGKDMALIDIINAAKEEGLMGPRRADRVRMRNWEAPQFADQWFHPAFADLLRDMYVNKNFPNTAFKKGLAKVDRAINMTKMLAFYNPIFLPMYDVVQMGLVSPAALGYLRKGWRDTKAKNQHYWDAQGAGVSSKPFSNPLKDFKKNIEAAQRHYGRETLEAVFNMDQLTRVTEGKGFERLPVLPEFYGAMWDMAWRLDGAVRQGTYRYLREKRGMGRREAAQMAAMFHGDYASVPAETRRMLNRFLFTPTFKIAMGKLYKRMMQDAIGMAKGKGRKGYAQGLAVALGMQIAFDTFMTQGLGFDRASFGRKYVKDGTTEDGFQKELVMVFSNPANMWNKYVERVRAAYHTEAFAANLAKMNMTEMTPLVRTALEIMTGTSMRTGKMYDWRFDNMGYIMKKAVPHMMQGIMGISREFPGIKTEKELEARYMAKKQLGTVLASGLSLITFAYTRDTANRRVWYRYRRLYRDFMGYMRKRAIEGEGVRPERIDNYKKELQNILKDLK